MPLGPTIVIPGAEHDERLDPAVEIEQHRWREELAEGWRGAPPANTRHAHDRDWRTRMISITAAREASDWLWGPISVLFAIGAGAGAASGLLMATGLR